MRDDDTSEDEGSGLGAIGVLGLCVVAAITAFVFLALPESHGPSSASLVYVEPEKTSDPGEEATARIDAAPDG
ncbi:MAG: hypothetical protein K5872_22970 [Rhizobiaceae bacterium]|nr:hypothetical protein [Rhizobiaceae bacterium]MCV0409083.1 hypothetical protein [Rhizobiaceae bacterium]